MLGFGVRTGTVNGRQATVMVNLDPGGGLEAMRDASPRPSAAHPAGSGHDPMNDDGPRLAREARAGGSLGYPLLGATPTAPRRSAGSA